MYPGDIHHCDGQWEGPTDCVDVEGHVQVLVQVAADHLALWEEVRLSRDKYEVIPHLAVVRPLGPDPALQAVPAGVVCKV